jgi:hypothetical protein
MNGKMNYMRSGVLVFVCALIVLFPVVSYAQSAKTPLLTFDDLRKYNPQNHTFRIKAFVFDIYKCPPCPPGAMCKPCIPDNLTVVDLIKEKDYSSMKRLRILTEQTDKFTRKGKYLFTVKVKENLSEGASVTEVELIGFEKLKSGKE